MLDTILYKRFFVVTVALAALAVLGSNLILETRPTSRNMRQPALELPSGPDCGVEKLCLTRLADIFVS